MNMQYLRLKVWDANRAAVRVGAPATADQVLYRSGNGANFDPSRPDIGKSHVSNFTRIGVPQAPAPVDEKAVETAKKAARLEARKINPQTGRPEIIEAGILNVHAASWIQFMVHDWMNHKRRPAAEDPFLIALDKDDPLRAQGFTHMKLDRTEKGGMVDSVPVFRNELTPGWDLSMIYGATDEIQATVRTFKDGKIKVDEKNKRLLEDPRNPGLPLTGMNDNLTPPLAFLHTLFHLEHNAVAEALKAEHRDWNDEEIFQIARLRLIALAAKIHTVEWTRALLPQDGLQVGMWVDWYGFVDKRLKGWVMRISNRRPTLGKILGKILRHEGIFGVPGTHTFHFGKDYAMPEEFVDVYRLHTMIRDYYKMQKLAADENGNVSIEVTLDVPLEDMVGVTETGRFKPQDFSEKFPMAEQAVSFAAQSAGALTLQNMPLGLRRLHTQDDQHKNLAIVHTLRTSERSEAKTYVKFTMKLGEKPPKTFLELTGGNAEIAKLLEDTFGTVDQVPFRAGILAERKPKGFALGNRQFKVFVLMAPRRLVSDKFLSKMYDAKYYGGQSGIDYVENTTMSDMVIRHFPETRPAFEGIDNFFKPTPPPGTQAERAIEAAQKTSEAIAGSDIVLTTTLLRAALKAVQAGKKDSALMFLRMAEKRGASDVRKRKVAVLALTTGIAALLLAISAITPIWTWAVVALGAGTLFTGVSTWKKINQLKDDLRNVRIILQSRIREGLPKIDPATLPGETAIQKRYWFLIEGKTVPVATFGDSYKALRRSGLPVLKSFVTAALSHLGFARKTQRNMTAEERSRFKPGFFDIYVPNIIDAQDYSNSRIYMSRATARAKGLKPGDVDMDEFARQAREAGMRLYFTAYDLARLREYNALRDKREGRGTWFQRIKGRLAAKRRADQLLDLFADRVVWQEAKFGKLAPAISLERLLEFYQGSAQQELLNERR